MGRPVPAETASLQEAWRQIPSPGVAWTESARFTGRRMARIIAIVVAIGSAAAGAQAVIAALRVMGEMAPLSIALFAVVGVSFLAMLISCVLDRSVRTTATIFSVVYPLALLAWPFVMAVDPSGPQDLPWIFFLINVGVAAALLAYPLRWQVVWAIGVPLLFGYARLAEGGFSRGYWMVTGFDVSFALILGAICIALGWMCRSVAAGVDEARASAVSSYTAAAAEEAAEQERIAIAALMHDSVLAALIAAERADSDRARDLAVVMAREALTRLANTDDAFAQEGSDEPVATSQIVSELRRILSELGADAVVEERGAAGEIPGRPARALVLASRQAIGNAIDHAQGRGLHVVVISRRGERITITITDTGPGFVVDEIGEDRLGIRASIFARMAGVAGRAEIDSAGVGTTVVLGWETP